MRKLSSSAPEVDFDRDDVADDADDFDGVTAPDALPLELNSSNGFTSAEKSLTAGGFAFDSVGAAADGLDLLISGSAVFSLRLSAAASNSGDTNFVLAISRVACRA